MASSRTSAACAATGASGVTPSGCDAAAARTHAWPRSVRSSNVGAVDSTYTPSAPSRPAQATRSDTGSASSAMMGTSGPRRRRSARRVDAGCVAKPSIDDGVGAVVRRPVGQRRGVVRPVGGAERQPEARGWHGSERLEPPRLRCDDQEAPSTEVARCERQQRADDARVGRREACEVARADAIHGVERVAPTGADHRHRPARRRGERLHLGERAEGVAGADDAEDAWRRRVALGVPRAAELRRRPALGGVRAGLVAHRVAACPPPARREHRADRVAHRAPVGGGRAGERQVGDDQELRRRVSRPVLGRCARRGLHVPRSGVGLSAVGARAARRRHEEPATVRRDAVRASCDADGSQHASRGGVEHAQRRPVAAHERPEASTDVGQGGGVGRARDRLAPLGRRAVDPPDRSVRPRRDPDRAAAGRDGVRAAGVTEVEDVGRPRRTPDRCATGDRPRPRPRRPSP